MDTLIVYSLLSLQKQVSSVQWASFNGHGKILSSKKEEDKQVSANKFINSRHVSSKVQSRFSHARSIDQFYANREHKAPREKENLRTQLYFLRLGLPSTLIRHENGAFGNALQTKRNLKTPASLF